MLLTEKILFKNSLKDIVAFRFDAFSKLTGIPIQLGLMYFLWNYIISQVDNSFDMAHVMGYYTLILILSLQFPFIRLSNDIQDKVIKGDYFRNIVSGISLTKEHFIDFLAKSLWFNLIAIPISLSIYHLLTDSPFDTIKAMAFIVHIFLGSTVLFFIWLLVGLSAFLIVMNMGLASLIFNLQRLCIGSIIPLSMLPGSVFTIIKFTPFPYVFYFAVEEYMNITPIDISLFIYQIFWCIILAYTAFLLERKTITKIELGIV